MSATKRINRKEEYKTINCPECNSVNYKFSGKSYNREGMKQRYKCKDCGYRYVLDCPSDRFNFIQQKKIFEPLKLNREKVTIISDAHIPLHDKKLFNIMLNVSQEKGNKVLVSDGDLLNVDAFSYFERKLPEESLARDFSFERMEVEETLGILEKNFDEIIINMGNHEINRLMAIFKGTLNLKDIFRLFTKNIEKYQITNRDHIILTSGSRKWRICHPKNYSQIKGRIGYRLANKYEMNIISAHGHFCGMNISESGKYVVIDSGGLFDVNKIAFIQTTNTYPEWNNGFVTIDGGYPELFNPLYKNLSEWQ